MLSPKALGKHPSLHFSSFSELLEILGIPWLVAPITLISASISQGHLRVWGFKSPGSFSYKDTSHWI